MVQIVKVFGERNTGTRAAIRMLRQLPEVAQRIDPMVPVRGNDALEAAIRAQFRGQWRKLYLAAAGHDPSARATGNDPWKHSVPMLSDGMIAARMTALFMVRDPYSWALALARRPYHMKGPRPESFEGFLTRPWMSEPREGVEPVLASPVMLWSRKLAGYRSFIGQATCEGLGTAVLQFEHFIADPVAELTGALVQAGLQPSRALQQVSETKGRGTLAEKQAYYGRAEWLNLLTRSNVDVISAQINWDLAEQFGYRPLTSGDFPEELSPHWAAARDALLSRSHREGRAASAA